MASPSVAAPRDFVTAYRLGQVAYVPHYRRTARFVGPGYHETHNPVTYSAENLLDAGAKPEQMLLWPRPQFAT
jgi:hypothetical protein